MFKVEKGLAPIFMNEIMKGAVNVSSNMLENAIFSNSSNPKTVNYGLDMVRCLGPKIWQLVPREIREITSLDLIIQKM